MTQVPGSSHTWNQAYLRVFQFQRPIIPLFLKSVWMGLLALQAERIVTKSNIKILEKPRGSKPKFFNQSWMTNDSAFIECLLYAEPCARLWKRYCTIIYSTPSLSAGEIKWNIQRTRYPVPGSSRGGERLTCARAIREGCLEEAHF